MGLPKILIEFKTLAETIISRSERGIVAVILKDNSNQTETYTYTKESEIIKSHFTATNLAFLQLIFMGSPSKVIVERVRTDDDVTVALERLVNKQWYYLTVPQITDDEIDSVVGFITEMRNQKHKTFKAILMNRRKRFLLMVLKVNELQCLYRYWVRTSVVWQKQWQTPRKPALKSISWSSFFPVRDYPFLRDRSDTAFGYLYTIDTWIKQKLPIRLIITDTPINMACCIDDFSYSIKKDGDMNYSITLGEVPLL